MRATHPLIFILIMMLFTALPVAASSDPLVCVYYYVWYSSDGRHWGGPGDLYWSVLDTPVAGYYDSRHLATIARHLEQLKSLGVDCLFISWWGPGSFEDEAAKRVFQLLPRYGLKAAILVEPYKGSDDPSLYNRSWWGQVLTYIRENYIDMYPESYLRLNDKPLVLAFNPIGLSYDPRPDYPEYTVRIVGNDIDNARYQDWDLWPDYDSSLTGELRLRRDGYVALAPRFDDEHFRPGGVPPYDPNLTEGWYGKQWQWVLEHRDEVRIIAVYSWNEYHERSMIEPHNDATAMKDPYYLYEQTQYYISKLSSDARSIYDNLDGIIKPIFAVGLVFAILFRFVRLSKRL